MSKLPTDDSKRLIAHQQRQARNAALSSLPKRARQALRQLDQLEQGRPPHLRTAYARALRDIVALLATRSEDHLSPMVTEGRLGGLILASAKGITAEVEAEIEADLASDEGPSPPDTPKRGRRKKQLPDEHHALLLETILDARRTGQSDLAAVDVFRSTERGKFFEPDVDKFVPSGDARKDRLAIENGDKERIKQNDRIRHQMRKVLAEHEASQEQCSMREAALDAEFEDMTDESGSDAA